MFEQYPACLSETVKPAGRSIRELLLPLLRMASDSDVLRADSVGSWRSEDESFFLPRFFFQRTQASKPRIKVAILAGIHGTDLGGILGLTEFVRALNTHPAIGRDYQLWLYPLCNPSGYVNCVCGLRSGPELDRKIWKNSAAPETRLLERERREHRFHGLISLYGNPTGRGVNAYVRGASLKARLLTPALMAAAQALPLQSLSQLDGFNAIQGIELPYYDRGLRASRDQTTKPFEIVIEIPKQVSLRLQAEVCLVLLHAILAAYRRISSEAGIGFLAQ